MPSQTTSIEALQRPAAPREAAMPLVTMGFGSLQSFELMQRAAKLLASSTLVPAQYRSVSEKYDRNGNVTERKENPNALPNCVVALNMAQRMNADPLMVMQNLYIVEGRPSWSSQWIIAAINGCGRFSPLRFEMKDLGKKKADYTIHVWNDQTRRKDPVTKTVEIHDFECVAWAIEKETGARIDSPKVSIEMAVKEGWYQKNGSKWQTMPEVMLRYRTASFFGKLYAPELLMGLQSAEEAGEIIDAQMGPDGSYSVSVETLREGSATPQTETQPGHDYSEPQGEEAADELRRAEVHEDPSDSQQDGGPTKADLLASIAKAKTKDELLDLEDLSRSLPEDDEIFAAIDARLADLEKAPQPRRSRSQMTIE